MDSTPHCASKHPTTLSIGKKQGMAQQLGRHLEPLDNTIKFQASPHKVQRKKEREQQRENNMKVEKERDRRVELDRMGEKW